MPWQARWDHWRRARLAGRPSDRARDAHAPSGRGRDCSCATVGPAPRNTVRPVSAESAQGAAHGSSGLSACLPVTTVGSFHPSVCPYGYSPPWCRRQGTERTIMEPRLWGGRPFLHTGDSPSVSLAHARIGNESLAGRERWGSMARLIARVFMLITCNLQKCCGSEGGTLSAGKPRNRRTAGLLSGRGKCDCLNRRVTGSANQASSPSGGGAFAWAPERTTFRPQWPERGRRAAGKSRHEKSH